jgi:hypothetical protein
MLLDISHGIARARKEMEELSLELRSTTSYCPSVARFADGRPSVCVRSEVAGVGDEQQ